MRGEGAVMRVEIGAPEPERDRLIAELYALGTLGLEEGDDGLTAYFPPLAGGDPVWASLAALADAARGIEVGPPAPVPPTDWEREWRRGLHPRQVAGLWIRPSWCEPQGEPELCIDPEQAFGSGEHATTRIALELVLEALRPGDRVLDVGAGSGVLALGALRLGASRAIGLDLDPAACRNARDNARRNGLSLELFCGTLAALPEILRVDVAVANMLWAELRPCLGRIAAHAERHVVLSGPLAREAEAVCVAMDAQGFRRVREMSEEQSGDLWWGARFDRAGS